MAKKLLGIEAIQGAWAIMPTPSRPDAGDWRAQDTVDLDETVRVINALIDAGVNGILALGTLGEAATLTPAERRAFTGASVETVAGRVPYFTGSTSMSTRETVAQTREAADVGVDGTMLGLPMWCAPDLNTAVDFYRDVAEACPDTAICVYANPQAFKFNFPPPFWAQVSALPQVITAKYTSYGRLVPDYNATRGKIRLMPIDADYYMAARLDPDFFTAFWSSGATCGPSIVTRLRDEMSAAKESGDWIAVKALTDAISQTYRTLIPRGDPAEFAKYNIQLEKARIDAAGWMTAGPCRPPYRDLPEDYLAGAQQSGAAWASLAVQRAA